MEYAVQFALVIALAVVLATYLQRKPRGDGSLPDYGIHLTLPLREPAELDPRELMSRFQVRWGAQVRCGENPQWGDPDKALRGYLVTDGTHSVLLNVSARPLDAQLTEVSLVANWHLTAPSGAQKARFRGHRAYVHLRYALGSQEPLARARFSAQVLLTLLDLLDGAIGYVNVHGQLYAPRETIEGHLPSDPLDPSGLFLLFANTQFVEHGSGHWIHTHGLDQFGLPDLEVRTTQSSRAGHYWQLVASTAAYMIERGPILKPGHTAELGGDGVIYLVRQARDEREHPYGAHGALELVEQ